MASAYVFILLPEVVDTKEHKCAPTPQDEWLTLKVDPKETHTREHFRAGAFKEQASEVLGLISKPRE